MRSYLIRVASLASVAVIVGAIAVVALAIATTGSSAHDSTSQGAEGSDGRAELVAERKRARAKLTLRRSRFGRVLFDGRNRVLYLFRKDGRKSRCYGECAEVWPPFTVRGKVGAGNGLKGRWIDTVKRRNGSRQVRFRGHPLYYYEHDSRGEIGCHDVREFGAKWLVVRKSGRPAP